MFWRDNDLQTNFFQWVKVVSRLNIEQYVEFLIDRHFNCQLLIYTCHWLANLFQQSVGGWMSIVLNFQIIAIIKRFQIADKSITEQQNIQEKQ